MKKHGLLHGVFEQIQNAEIETSEQQEVVHGIDVRMHQAARNADIKRMSELLRSDVLNIERMDDRLSTPIFHAVWSRQAKAVKFLCDLGADVRHSDDRDAISLHYAARDGDVEIIALLLDAAMTKSVLYEKFQARHPFENADCLSWADDKGETPLFYAILHEKLEAVRLLLELGADLEHCNHKGETPYQYSLQPMLTFGDQSTLNEIRALLLGKSGLQ